MTDRPGGHDMGTGGTWGTVHERARTLLAERMDEPLQPRDAEWIDGHLAGCADCRLVDTEYRASREALRSLVPPIPPRDLWARTSAALDREERRTRTRRPWTIARLATASRSTPFGVALTAVVVVAVIASSTLLTDRATPASTPSGPIAVTSGAPATPITVGAGDVAWFTASGDGSYLLNSSHVEQVCPATAAIPCATLDATAEKVPLLAVKPTSVYGSPTRDQVVVLGRKAGSASFSLFVMSVARTPGPKATPTASVRPSSSPSVRPSGPASPTPSAPQVSATPVVGPTSTPPASPPVSQSPGSSPDASPTIIPGETPSPTAAAVLAIASGLVVVGQTAAYSPDATWFAFNARPADAPSGSDIYLWRSGEQRAVPITTDGRSVFSGWVGDRLVGSRVDPVLAAASPSPSADGASAVPSSSTVTVPSAAPSDAPPSDAAPSDVAASASPGATGTSGQELTATSFLLDPATGVTAPLAATAWRPVVDPSGRLVVFWDGSIIADPTTGSWIDGTGQLVVGSWPSVAGAALTGAGVTPLPSASAEPDDAATPSPASTATSPVASGDSASPDSASPSIAPSIDPATEPAALPAEIGSAAGLSWDAAWDETGEHLAIWIGDTADAASGRVSLVSIDPATRGAQTSGPSLLANPALPGLSLSDGHLAWATPPDATGSGSRLQVFAWSGPEAGKIDSRPAGASDTVIVVQH